MNSFLKDWPIKIIGSKDKDFPKRLKKIKNPPKELFYRGNFNNQIFDKCMAVVGSRRHTKYGADMVDMMVPKLLAQGFSIVSGFMWGIDSLAHNCCIENGGKTIAVLGNGLDVIYPPKNDKLYLKILESGGLIISEYEANFKPTLWTFPQRNRIVAGLTNMGILVIEAGCNSGSLITARIGRLERKKVYCVPGPINSKVSMGCNQLIRDGEAKMVVSVDDILPDKSQSKRQMELFLGLSSQEKEIIKLLENEALSADEIGRKMKIDIAKLLTILSMMEMQELISETGGKYYLSSI